MKFLFSASKNENYATFDFYYTNNVEVTYFDNNLSCSTFNSNKIFSYCDRVSDYTKSDFYYANNIEITYFDNSLSHTIFNNWISDSLAVKSHYFDNNLYSDDIEASNLEIITDKILNIFAKAKDNSKKYYTEKFIKKSLKNLKNTDIFNIYLEEKLKEFLSYIFKYISFIFKLRRKIKLQFFSSYTVKTLYCNMLNIMKNNLIFLNLFKYPSFIQ